MPYKNIIVTTGYKSLAQKMFNCLTLPTFLLPSPQAHCFVLCILAVYIFSLNASSVLCLHKLVNTETLFLSFFILAYIYSDLSLIPASFPLRNFLQVPTWGKYHSCWAPLALRPCLYHSNYHVVLKWSDYVPASLTKLWAPLGQRTCSYSSSLWP